MNDDESREWMPEVLLVQYKPVGDMTALWCRLTYAKGFLSQMVRETTALVEMEYVPTVPIGYFLIEAMGHTVEAMGYSSFQPNISA
jgi:hypothetical protein